MAESALCRIPHRATVEELRKYEQKLKVFDLDKMKMKVDKLVDRIIEQVRNKEKLFDFVKRKRGSIYEKTKIDCPDEFDFDLIMKLLEIDDPPRPIHGLSEGKGNICCYFS